MRLEAEVELAHVGVPLTKIFAPETPFWGANSR
jgi:hypothetical protein